MNRRAIGHLYTYLSMLSLCFMIPSMTCDAKRATSWTVANRRGGITMPGFELIGSGMRTSMYMSFSQYV